VSQTIFEQAKSMHEQLIAWRRIIHQNPELGFEETKTSNFVAQTLREMGVETEVGVGRTGIVARFGNGDGRKIGIRADMDALPIQEANDVPYKSQVDGKMHACGHDAHTAMLLGVARILSQQPTLDGEIRLLFQPSEERWDADGVSGATAMIADQALEELDHVIALHVDSTSPAGKIMVGDGFMMAAVDTFSAIIKGEGGHAASPHKTIDPIFMQAQVVNAIQGIRSRRLDPTAPSVITIGAIHGGTATNIIPHEVKMLGTIRSFSEDIREQLHEQLDQAFQITRALGGDYELEIQRGYPALYNDPQVAESLRQVAREFVGDNDVELQVAQMGAEDFAYMAQKAPGAMMMLGAKYDDMHRPHHSPIFDISEEPLPIGTAVLAQTALRLLRG
jgi:amidohydrolase